MEEKPNYPKSKIGIAGVYFIRHTSILLSIIDNMIKNCKHTKGEYQITDALQKMVNIGYKLKTFQATGWYDCRHSESLLETNRLLLEEKLDEKIKEEIIH